MKIEISLDFALVLAITLVCLALCRVWHDGNHDAYQSKRPFTVEEIKP